MKKILKLFIILPILSYNSSTIIACQQQEKDKFLTFTTEEEGYYDNEWHKGLVDDIVLNFMYALPKDQAPKLDRSNFKKWSWKWTNDEMTGYGHIIGDINKNSKSENMHEYWQITVKKSLFKGIFVQYWQENDYCPWV